jgi:uncharacterized protein (TIGR00369 family)
VTQTPEPGTFFGLKSPFIDFCGFEPVAADTDGVTIRLSPRPELMNARGVTHGGVLVSLFDVTLGLSVMFAAGRQSPAVTVSINTSFLSPAVGVLECRGRVLRVGGRLTACEGEIFADGTLCAKAMATYSFVSSGNDANSNKGT